MYTIEFRTKIENGTIRVPEKYRQCLQEQGGDEPVRVIIQVLHQQPVTDYIDHLLVNPIIDEHFTPLERDAIHERD